MSVDLISPRPDVVFLRRRLKVGGRVPTAPVAVQPATNFLGLSTNNSSLEAPTVSPSALPEKPSVARRTVLNAGNPVVRLNARQSSMGSLVASGATVFGWQTKNLHGGIVHSHSPDISSGGINHEMPLFNKRKLVEFYKDDVIVGLRHFSNLRRLILGADSGVITLTLFDGANISLDTNDGENVFYLSVINNIIEVRFEKILNDIDTTFSVTPTVS